MSSSGGSGYPDDVNRSDTLFMARIVKIAVRAHSRVSSGRTSDREAPILCTRINAGTALLDGSSRPMVCIHRGKASTGSDVPLSSRMGIDVQMIIINGSSTLLNSVESAMASIITAAIYDTITTMAANRLPLSGYPKIW